jgi:hypothetical protein
VALVTLQTDLVTGLFMADVEHRRRVCGKNKEPDQGWLVGGCKLLRGVWTAAL